MSAGAVLLTISFGLMALVVVMLGWPYIRGRDY